MLHRDDLYAFASTDRAALGQRLAAAAQKHPVTHGPDSLPALLA